MTVRAPVAWYTAAVAACTAFGVWMGLFVRPVYDYAWSHPAAMITCQFTLLMLVAAGTRVRPVRWPVEALFWVFTGATAAPLLFRAADVYGSFVAGAGVAACAVVVAWTCFFAMSHTEEGVGRASPRLSNSHKSIVDNG